MTPRGLRFVVAVSTLQENCMVYFVSPFVGFWHSLGSVLVTF